MKVSIGAPIYDKREIQAVLRALREKRLSQGKYVKAFERAWVRYIGCRFSIGVNSGSSANLVAIQAMKERYGWKVGDTVIAPALTFATAVMPVLQAGLRPLFADVDYRGNMTAKSVLAAFRKHRGPKVRGLVLVHSLGVPCLDAPKIQKFCREKGIRILEDCCESHGAKVQGKMVGSFGDVSTTSFYVAHNMTTGEGGMITTDDPKLDEICRSLREFGRRIDPKSPRYVRLASGPSYDIRYAFDRLGYNVRMTDIAASLGLVQLSKLEKMNAKRRQIAGWYKKGFLNLISQRLISLPDEPAGTKNTYYTLLITFLKMPPRLPSIEKIALRLEKAGIETRPFMAGNLLRQRAFSRWGKPQLYPMAEFLHRRSLSVGCHPLVTEAGVSYVCENINRLYAI